MSYRFLLALFSVALLLPGGCGTIEKDKKSNAMDAALNTYGDAIRWGYFETAYSYVHPDKLKEAPMALENIRVTSYDVRQAPLMLDEENAEQVVRIEYVQKDVQQVRTLSDRQLWRYEKDTGRWWLYSGIPRFK